MPRDAQPDTPVVARTLIQCREGDNVAWVFISNPDRNNRLALAGGSGQPGETPEEAALREMAEETGIRAHLDELFLEADWDDRLASRVNPEELVTIHKYLYIVTIPTSRARVQRYHPKKNPTRARPSGNGGEKAHIVTVADMPWMLSGGRFVPEHLEYLRRSDRNLINFLRSGRLIPPRPH